jgi:hypothetical protein
VGRFLEAGSGFRGHVVDDGFEAAGFAEDLELAIGAAALREHGVDVVDLGAAAQFVEDIVNESEVLEDEFANGHFGLFAEVDHLAVDAVADGAEFVLHQKGAGVLAIVDVARVEVPELAGGGLDERGDGDGLLRAEGDVADPDFDGVEERMGANVPPDFFGVIDGVCLDEEVYVAFELGVAREAVGQVGSGKVFEDLGAVALVAGLHA